MTRRTRGLTLLELLLAVALLGGVATGTGWFLRTAAVRAEGLSGVAESLLLAVDLTLQDSLHRPTLAVAPHYDHLAA